MRTNLKSETTLSQELGLSKRTIARARQAGKIGYYRVGRRILYGPEHIEAWLAQTEQLANQP